MEAKMESVCKQLKDHNGWLAHLELEFAHRNGSTVLVQNRHTGPLRLQRPLYPEKEVCHAYILHPPGGVVGGDRIVVDAAVQTDAKALLTTPGAAKFYRSDGPRAEQEFSLSVQKRGSLEYFPQESIVYPGANVCAHTRLNLVGRAFYIGWEIWCLGLPACGQPFKTGFLNAEFQIHRNNCLIFSDRLRVRGEKDLNRPSGLRGCSVTATFVATGCRPEMVTPLRQIAHDRVGTMAGLTLMDDLLVARAIGDDSFEIKSLFHAFWMSLRPSLTGNNACVPRIWET